MSAATTVLRELIAQYPNHPARTLARIAYNEHPELWPSLEACRDAVRTNLGVHGKHQRKYGSKQFHRAPRKAGWTDVIPESILQLGAWKPLEIAGPARVLLIGDIHIPFLDRATVELALDHGSDKKATIFLLNGDIVDHYALSRWEQNPKMRDFPAEIRATKQFLTGLRQRFPRARIIYKHGNHEERYEKYLRMKAPDLLGVPDFEWENIYELAKHRIELVHQKRPIKLGQLNTLHGHEYRFAISNPVNPARGLYLRAKAHALCNHFHQTSHHSEKNVEGKVVTTFSVGCACDMHPEYLPLNNWNQGFAFIEVEKNGDFNVDNLKVISGKAFRS